MFRSLDTSNYFFIQCATVLRSLSNTVNQHAKKESKRTNKTREMASKLLFTADGVHTLLFSLFSTHSDQHSWQFIYYILWILMEYGALNSQNIMTRRVCASSFSLFSRHVIKKKVFDSACEMMIPFPHFGREKISQSKTITSDTNYKQQ